MPGQVEGPAAVGDAGGPQLALQLAQPRKAAPQAFGGAHDADLVPHQLVELQAKLGDAAAPGLVTLSIVAACGSLLIPYLRARAEGLGVDGKGGWFGRAERLLVFGIGVGLAGLDLPTLEPALWILAVGTWVTVVQRFIQTWHRLPG